MKCDQSKRNIYFLYDYRICAQKIAENQFKTSSHICYLSINLIFTKQHFAVHCRHSLEWEINDTFGNLNCVYVLFHTFFSVGMRAWGFEISSDVCQYNNFPLNCSDSSNIPEVRNRVNRVLVKS